MFVQLENLLTIGGTTMWAILITSVIIVAVIMFKIIQFTTSGYWWRRGATRGDIITAQSGLRILEIGATVAPLLGLLGTVLGMITAFQTLSQSGGTPEITALAGGIWQALATTAAGMVVSIIATVALGLFDGAVARLEAHGTAS